MEPAKRSTSQSVWNFFSGAYKTFFRSGKTEKSVTKLYQENVAAKPNIAPIRFRASELSIDKKGKDAASRTALLSTGSSNEGNELSTDKKGKDAASHTVLLSNDSSSEGSEVSWIELKMKPKKLENHQFTNENKTPDKLKFGSTLEAIFKGQLANKAPSINKGACESRTYVDETNKGVGIFKDLNPRDLSIKRTLEIAFKKLFNIRRPTELLPGKDPRSKAFAEKVAYDLDREFGFNMVPVTDFTFRPGDETPEHLGTLQVFVENHKEAAEVFSLPNHAPTEQELLLFQKLTIFDMLTGGIDRHDENWMVELDKDGKMINLAIIDNGNAFIEHNPNSSDKTILKNQYRWGEHPFSNAPFSDEMVKFVQGIDENKLRNFFANKELELSRHPNPDVREHTKIFFSDQMIDNVFQRLAVMKTVVTENTTPHDLSQIKTDEQIQAVLAPKIKYPEAEKKAISLLRLYYPNDSELDGISRPKLIEKLIAHEAILNLKQNKINCRTLINQLQEDTPAWIQG